MKQFAVLCVVAVACARPKPAPVTPVQPQPPGTPIEAASTPAETKPTPATPTPPAAGSPAAHCLFVEPDHRIVRCYWKREDCEQQIEFNKGVVAGNQTCEATAEAHCFDENGKNQLCYPSAADCDGMVAKMKKRNRPVSQCASKRGP